MFYADAFSDWLGHPLTTQTIGAIAFAFAIFGFVRNEIGAKRQPRTPCSA
jgi:hypothetical protein